MDTIFSPTLTFMMAVTEADWRAGFHELHELLLRPCDAVRGYPLVVGEELGQDLVDAFFSGHRLVVTVIKGAFGEDGQHPVFDFRCGHGDFRNLHLGEALLDDGVFDLALDHLSDAAGDEAQRALEIDPLLRYLDKHSYGFRRFR
jgi:hypothetical protein